MRNEILVIEARKLKKRGWSNVAIASKLGITNSIVSRWCNEITDNRIQGIVDYYQKKRMSYMTMDPVRVKRLNVSNVRLYAALMYWCEGSKYPSESRVSFTSSDIVMQKLFVELLRKGFKIDEKKFRVLLQLHTNHDEKNLISYWSEVLNVPKNRFIKSRVSVKKGGKYRTYYKGTCTLRYNDYSILLRLMGIYKRFCSQALDKLS